MVGTMFSFSSMAVAGREISFALSPTEIMLYRSLFGFVIVVGVISVTGKLAQISMRSLRMHLIRNCAHFCGQNLWFFAMTIIPLAQVFALEFTSPIWVLILAPFLLNERLTRMRILSAVMGFIGILIVARPTPDAINVGVLSAASAAFFFAITLTYSKKLTKFETVGNILFWLTLIQLVLGVVFAGLDGDIAIPDAKTAPWLLVIAISGLAAHFCLTNALAIAPATVVIPMDFMRLPAIAVVGMVLYHEAIDIWILIGAAIIFSGNYLNIHAETRQNRNA